VTHNPMQAGFRVIVHQFEPVFYDRNYREGYVTPRIRTDLRTWHPQPERTDSLEYAFIRANGLEVTYSSEGLGTTASCSAGTL
jgi:hypothetical protein